MQPTQYQPRFPLWSHAWRIVLVLAISGGAWYDLARWQWTHGRTWWTVDLGLGLFSLILVFWRRRNPVGVAVITALATAVSASSGGPATLALVSMSTRRRWREIIPVAITSLAAAAVLDVHNPTTTDDTAVILTAVFSVIGVSIGWGMYIGSRRELLAILRDRADRAVSEQQHQIEQSRIAERARIAREMHDVLAHRISLVSMHAGALAFREDLSPLEVRNAAKVIHESSHQALIELRQVLGVLREGPGDAQPDRPQPSAADLIDLIVESRRAGMRIETEHGIGLDDMPDSLGRTLYRIVQEGLTNARKHAADTRVIVNLYGDPSEGLTIEVRNPLRIGDNRLNTPPSGLGLIGLAERAELAGGRLEHQITPEREFVLTAWIPWPS